MSTGTASTPDVLLLSCGVGRGHPFYLDGIAAALASKFPDIVVENKTVFDLAHAPARLGWGIGRMLYHYGSQGGWLTKIYQKLRNDRDRPTRTWLLGSGLIEKVRDYRRSGALVIVDHPILAANLVSEGVWYQHGELIVPQSSIVSGCPRVFVPTSEAADCFIKAGSSIQSVVVTGCCLELEIEEKKKVWYEAREKRLGDSLPLTLGVFSSGAEPAAHLEVIMYSLSSLARSDHKAVVFAGKSGVLHPRVAKLLNESAVHQCELIGFETRAELHCETMNRFGEFDLFIAPYHERINWSVAAGLPILGLQPPIGPFAPLNRVYVKRFNTGDDVSLSQARAVGDQLHMSEQRERLVRRSQRGMTSHESGGFKAIAQSISTALKRR